MDSADNSLNLLSLIESVIIMPVLKNPENTASTQLHKNHGFRIIGYREKIGLMGSIWRDTILLERRSKKIGTQPGALT